MERNLEGIEIISDHSQFRHARGAVTNTCGISPILYGHIRYEMNRVGVNNNDVCGLCVEGVPEVQGQRGRVVRDRKAGWELEGPVPEAVAEGQGG